MTSALVIPTPGSSMTAVRYYQPLDPYYYTIDNRPLADLDANVQGVMTGAVDALFRASALNSNLSPVASGALVQPTSSGQIVGLQVSLPSTGSVSIGQGVLYARDNINATTAVSVVKSFTLIAAQTLSTPVPGSAGQSVNYLIQGKVSYLDLSSMATSALPFVSTTNASLPGLLANGELKVSVLAGTAATTGSQVTPSPDAGAYPLYVVTVANGGATTVALASGAPVIAGLNHQTTVSPSATGAATAVAVCGSTQYKFVDGSTTSVNLQIPLDGRVNPFLPIKLRLTMSSSTGSNAASFQVSYLVLGSGDLSTTSPTTATADSLSIPVTANASAVFTLANGLIPPSAFSGFDSNNVWSVTKSRLFVQLSRLGGAGPDTNVGDVTLLDAVAFQ